MAKKKQKPSKPKTALLQTNVQSDLEQRFYASPEYQLHRNISAALRAILDRVLPQTVESQE